MVPPLRRMARPHLISAPGTEFRFWRWFLLRSAGFPYERLEGLSSAELGVAADRALRAEAEVEAARESAAAALAAVPAPEKEERRRVLGLIRAVRGAAEVDPAGAPEPAREPLRRLVEAARAAREAKEAYRTEEARALGWARAGLREALGDPRLRESLLLQSREAYRAVERLPPLEAPRTSAVRRTEQTAVLHVQRCCAKNDTISFFGPIACGEVGGSGHLWVAAGESLVVRRRVFFEQWAIRAFADAVSADAAVRPHLRPRLSPRVRLDGAALVVPVDRRSELPEGYAGLLARCDGTRTGAALEGELAGSAAFPTEADVREALEELREAGAVLVQVELPTATWEPERALREELERLPAEVGAPWLRRLDALEHARGGFAEPLAIELAPRQSTPVGSSGHDASASAKPGRSMVGSASPAPFTHAEARARALDRLGEAFAEATHLSATRGGGKFYEARAAVYEDCVRGVRDLRLGEDFLERAAPALDLVLGSARWYALELEARALGAARAVLQELGAPVDYTRFLVAFKKRFTAEDAAAAEAELQRRWRTALDLGDLSQPKVERSAEELRVRLDLSHALRAPRWGHGRYHSPDLMVSAASPEAFARGEYQLVLGEVHACANTVNAPVWMAMLEERADAAAATAADAERWVAPVPEPESASRVAAYLLENPALVEVETGRAPSRLPRDRVVALGDLEVIASPSSSDGEPAVRTRDGRHAFRLLELLDFGMSALHQAGLDLLGGREPHRPRVTVSGAVLSREQWTLPGPVPGADPFLEVRRWARSAGLPRRFFARFPAETKPLCVDLDSPLLVEAFARMAGASADQGRGPLRLSEMLPGPDALWLPDASGRRYTAELRLVAVDPRCAPTRPPTEGDRRRGPGV